MYLFTRRARLAAGHAHAAMGWAVTITERVNQLTGLPVTLYQQIFSPAVGTLVWSAFVPDMQALETANDKLATDDGYLDLLDTGAAFTEGTVDDAVGQVVYGEPDPTRSIEYVTAVQAVCTAGNLANGMTGGIELAERATAITGVPTLFVAGVTGVYGSVGWINGFEDIGAMERSQQALMADPEWVDLIDRKVAGVYVEAPELTTQLAYRRLA